MLKNLAKIGLSFFGVIASLSLSLHIRVCVIVADANTRPAVAKEILDRVRFSFRLENS